jgi:hypothetical protein
MEARNTSKIQKKLPKASSANPQIALTDLADDECESLAK